MLGGPYSEEYFWVVLEATRGDGGQGDIALDDVDLYHGRCFVPRK